METSKPGSNVADRGTLAKQGDMITSAGVMTGGRCVRQQKAAVPISGQIAVAPDTSRSTILGHTATPGNLSGAAMGMASMGTASAREQEEIPETTGQPEDLLMKSFRRVIDGAVDKLSGAVMRYKSGKISALSLGMSIAAKIETLSDRREISTHVYVQYIRTWVGPFYADYLNRALQNLQYYVTAERSWEHYEELSTLARCFDFYPKDKDSRRDKEMLAEVYQQFVNSELAYLDNTKDSVFQYSRERSFRIINTLLADDSPAHRFKILENDLITELKAKAVELRNNREDLPQQIQDGSDERIAQEIAHLQQKIRAGTSDMTGKRQYHDVVMEKIEFVAQEWERETINTSDHNLVQFIITLAECCDKYDSFLREFRKLKEHLNTLASCITSYTLVIIKDRGNDVDQLKKRTTIIIYHLLSQGWLNDECRNLYHRCSQPQSTVQTGQITDLQFHWQLSAIISLMNQETHADPQENYLMAADMLTQLLNCHENELDTLCTKNTLRSLIELVRSTLYTKVYKDLMVKWGNLLIQKPGLRELDKTMSTYYSTFIKLNPYTPVVLYEAARLLWQKMACLAWNSRLRSISDKQGLLDARDVDTLLALKAIVLDVSERFTRRRMECILSDFFMCESEKNSTAIPAGKIAELSEWADFLIKHHDHSDSTVFDSNLSTLIKYNNQWKTKHGYKTTIAPGEVTPILTHPGTVTLMKVPGCPHCTEQQLMPFPAMQPLAAPHDMPTPDNQQFCQQPATVVYGSPATQSPMATEPHPAPIQQFQPTHYGMPTPDNQQFCQQPATLVYGSPATQTQSPMAAGPYPVPIQQFQPTHYGMPTPDNQQFCQQPATVVYGSPATQSPMAAGPYPAPIQQFQPTHYGMPTPDNQQFCQQPATLVYSSPATQSPMAAGPYPAPIQQFQPAHCRTLTGNQLPTPAMMSHFSAHPHVQVCPSCRHFTACEPVQSQKQMATQQQYSVQPAISGHKPESSGNF